MNNYVKPANQPNIVVVCFFVFCFAIPVSLGVAASKASSQCFCMKDGAIFSFECNSAPHCFTMANSTQAEPQTHMHHHTSRNTHQTNSSKVEHVCLQTSDERLCYISNRPPAAPIVFVGEPIRKPTEFTHTHKYASTHTRTPDQLRLNLSRS